jgi:hypothetical protein
MPIFEVDPLNDPRWKVLVDTHPRSSAFHSVEWLDTLFRTYHYTPKVYTTCASDVALTNGIVLCQIDSWLTGSRLVSLPFSDHCEPLVRDSLEFQILLDGIRRKAARRFKYVEVRPRYSGWDNLSGVEPKSQQVLQVLDLSPGLDRLYSGLHKDCIQRKVRRAERDGVIVSEGQSAALLDQFFALQLMTRRRYGLPPQPLAWFQNLVKCFGFKLKIRVATLNGEPIASILTLRHKQTIVYKYGSSDRQFHRSGGMPLLFWKLIEEAKAEEMLELDLGRSSPGHTGSIQFKEHLGAAATGLNYWQFSPDDAKNYSIAVNLVDERWIRQVVTNLPESLLRIAGEVFYRHIG